MKAREYYNQNFLTIKTTKMRTLVEVYHCIILMQKEYNTRNDWVRKVMHQELCKKFKFDHTNKWYMNNPESDLERDAQTPLGF